MASGTFPHTLGLDLVIQSDLLIKEALESFKEHFIWLDEILETAEAALQSSQLQVLPKTPSAKQRCTQRKRSELPSFIHRTSISVGKIHFSEADTSSGNDENIAPEEESNGNTSNRYPTRSTRQRTVQISKVRKQPARGKSKRNCSNSTDVQNGQELTSKTGDSASPAKKPLSDSNDSKTGTSPIASATEGSPNKSVTSEVEYEKQVSPGNKEHRVDKSSYVIESENPSLDIPNIDEAQSCEDASKTDQSKNSDNVPKTDVSRICQDIAKTDDSQNSEVIPKSDHSQNGQDAVPIKSTEKTNSDSGIPADTKSSSSNSEESALAEASSSSAEVPQASSPQRPRTRTRQMQRQAEATATVAALNDDNHSSDVSRPCTRNSSYLLANRSFNRNNYSLSKFVRNGTLTGSAQKNNTHSRLKRLSKFGNFRSLLKKTSTPIKTITSKEIIELKKRELETKERKEKERMMKREEIQRLKLTEQRRKREERMRKVAETREIKKIQEQEQKDKKTKKLEEKLSTTDRVEKLSTTDREERLREDREKVRLSYEITPKRSSYNNYGIDDLKDDDSTDEESSPQEPIPKWAQDPELKIALFVQYYNPPNLDQMFHPTEIPDLNVLFVKKKTHFNHRSSSAHWDSPILRSHLPVLH